MVFGKTLLMVAVITVISFAYREEIELLNIAMFFLLPILYIALYTDKITTLVLSLIATVIFDFLFVPPYYVLSVHNGEYIFSFLIMIGVGQLVSHLSTQANNAKELEGASKVYSAVLGSLTHELKTPLSVIIGSTNTVLSPELTLSNTEKMELCENAHASAKTMEELVENLLMSARFESGNIKVLRSACSVSEVVSSALVKAEKKHGKSAHFELDEELPSLHSDAVLLEQAFYNLLDNAFKYGDGVKIAVRASGEEIIVTICNDGKLPAPEELKSLGTKFNRLMNSRKHQGLGLGFFIARSIFEALEVSLESYLAESHFCVKLVMR